MNIFSNFVLNKIKFFIDSDSWVIDDMKNKVKLKQMLRHRYLRNQRNNEDFTESKDICNIIDKLISKSRRNITKISTES